MNYCSSRAHGDRTYYFLLSPFCIVVVATLVTTTQRDPLSKSPPSYPSQLIISHPSRPMYHQRPNSSSSSRNKASWGCRDLLSTSKQMMPSRVKLRHRTSFLLKSLFSPFAIAGRLKRRRDLVDVSIAPSSPPSIVSGRLQHLLQNNSLLARLAKGSVPF